MLTLTPGKVEALQRQYRRLYEELEALMNRPPGMRWCAHYIRTVEHLQARLAVLERQLTGKAS